MTNHIYEPARAHRGGTMLAAITWSNRMAQRYLSFLVVERRYSDSLRWSVDDRLLLRQPGFVRNQLYRYFHVGTPVFWWST